MSSINQRHFGDRPIKQIYDPDEPDNEDYEGSKPPEYFRYFKEGSSSTSPNVQEAEEPSYFKHFPNAASADSGPKPRNETLAYATAVPSGIKAAAAAAPRSIYDTLKFALSKVGGIGGESIAKGLEYLEKNAPDKVKDFVSAIFPTYEEAREEIPEWLSPKAEGPGQQFLEKVGRFGLETAATGGATSLPKFALGTTGAAAGQQAGEEFELPPLAQAALAMTGGFAGNKLSGLRTPRQRLTPEVTNYIQASRALGIDPLATGMNPSQLQKVAQKWASHGHGGPEILENAYRQRSGQVATALEETLDQLGHDLYNNPVEAGEALQQGIERARDQVEHTKRQLYQAVDATIPQGDRLRLRPGQGQNAEGVSNTMIQAQNLLEQNITHAPKEGSTLRRLQQARDDLQRLNERGGTTQLLDAQGNLIREPAVYEMGVKEVENARRSLGEVINFERPGGADKLLRPVYEELGNILDRYGRRNPAYGNAREAANNYFRDEVLNIRTNLLDAVKEGKIPEQAINKMNTVSGIRQVRQALANLPDGQQIMDSLSRYKTQQLIFDKIINPETGLMKLPKGAGNGIHNFLSKDRKTYQLLQELVPPSQMQRLHQLEHTGRGLHKGFNALVNPSGTADTLLAIHEILGPAKQIGKGIGQVLKANLGEGALNIAGGAVKFLAPRAVARMITDPEFANRIYQLSQSADRSNWTIFNRLLRDISSDLQEEKKE
jgi:hypothetical protein